jgi:hypothetical protein
VLASGCFYCSFYSMVESCWPTLVTMQEHVQNLVSQGCITVAELATCHVPADPGSPILVGGYVVACSAFYEQGFGMPSHRFVHLLLQFYGLEMHHLSPSEVLHIVAFVTLCDTYIGNEPHFNSWNNFFCIRLQPELAMNVAVWGSVNIFVQSGLGIDLFFRLLMSNPSVGWQTEWFFLWHDADVPLPAFMGNRPIPQHS